jgi:predicted  nucleic acid-binding Zn-ribbon protein
LNEDITKNRKGVANFKKRAKYLENLIDDTEKQIKQLEEDQKEYRQKTGEMVEELKKKEILINQKEEMIKRLLVENKHVRGFKDIHEYLMKEYTNETIPNEIKAE